MASQDKRRVCIGVAGLGAAAQTMLPAIKANERFRLVAVTDADAATLASVAESTGARACPDIESLVDLKEIEIVYIATPTLLHARHARLAAAAGKHVIVEKPMAGTLAEAQSMIDAAQRAGVALIVGHSRSFDKAIRRMRDIIAGGTLGRARLIQSTVYTDWIYRPRRPDELDPEQGGGVIFRQGAHQFDVIRLLGGGLLKSVRANVFDLDRSRPAAGAHAAFLSFADGATATAVYNGYGCFMTPELCFGIGERGFPMPPEELGAARKSYMERQPGSETAAKRKRGVSVVRTAPPHHPFFGMTLVSCEGGDIRQAPDGLYVYSAKGREEIRFAPDNNVYDAVLDELMDVLDTGARPRHDGRWGLANLEVCVAALASARSGQEQPLAHQVGAAG